VKGIDRISSYDYDAEEEDGGWRSSVTTEVCESIRVMVYLFKKEMISSYMAECK
jgi:hypothetical protein